MAMIALLLPVLLMLMLFGMDAWEDFLFPRNTKRSKIDAGELPKLH
ncbi:hypothetical protein [Streptomyces luteogriseus]|nr:hypothetical protein [Streptomyces luteogriseus]WTJ26927.1 hypothetical protein OID52_07600 [Streptomyces luteogriseus]